MTLTWFGVSMENFEYKRVIPRDFFNEAKLLNCLGRFQIFVIEGRVGGLPIHIEFDGGAFDIRQSGYDGCLYVINYRVYLDKHEIVLFTNYNSRERWPLVANYKGVEYYVFDDHGNWMSNFGWRGNETV